MKNIPIIGISGKARSGKDESSSILQAHTGYKSYALAQPIKECVNEIFGWDENHAYGNLKEVITRVKIPNRKTVVKIIRKHIGEHIKSAHFKDDKNLYNKFYETVIKDDGNWRGSRANISPRIAYQRFGTNFARNNFSDSIWFDKAPQSGIIISDVRFDNEADWIRNSGGIVINITRENMPEELQVAVHESENGIKTLDSDIFITNPDSKKWFEKLKKLLITSYEKAKL